MPKTKDTVIKAMKKYTAKPDVKARLNQYYKDNKELYKQRSREQYLKTKTILDKYKSGLLVEKNDSSVINSSVLPVVESNAGNFLN